MKLNIDKLKFVFTHSYKYAYKVQMTVLISGIRVITNYKLIQIIHQYEIKS